MARFKLTPEVQVSLPRSSSHIEGYISDLNEIIFHRLVERRISIKALSPSFCYYLSRDILVEILDTSAPEKIAKKLQTLHKRDSFIWDEIDVFEEPLDCQRFLKGFSTPKPKNIYALFNRYGHDQLSKDIASVFVSLHSFHQTNVENTVRFRNEIAHGNHSLTQTPSDLFQLADSTKVFCREIDNSVCDWFKGKKCSLR